MRVSSGLLDQPGPRHRQVPASRSGQLRSVRGKVTFGFKGV